MMKMRLRRALGYAALLVAVATPFVAYWAGSGWVGLVGGGLALLLFSIACVLTPDSIY